MGYLSVAWANSFRNWLISYCREDIQRLPQRLPRPLTAEQDELLQQEFLRRNDLGGNVFLLIRHTGMRIGGCADLSYDCLRSTGPDQWAIHLPLGKLKTERMVPVDSFVCELVQRLRFFRFLDPLPADGWLGSTYATEMLRTGVTFPALMKLLGHTSADMTMQYLDVALHDLQREFELVVHNRGILFRSPGCPLLHFARVSMGSSILCSLPNMCSRCFAVHYQTAPLAVASIGSPIASLK